MPELIKWPSIELFHNVLKGVLHQASGDPEFVIPAVKYMGKAKLDGTNSGIQIGTDGSLIPQSHSCLLIGRDNYGFATWVEKNKEYFSALKNDKHTVIFGEFCGAGIQKRTAISKIDRKIFAVFAIKFDSVFCVEPETIRAFLPEHKDIFVIDWLSSEEISIDFADRNDIEGKVEKINKMVEEVESCDPWVKEKFGIEGIGEGIVFYPVSFGSDSLSSTKLEYCFKAKGEKHQAVKQSKLVIVDVEKLASSKEFVAKFLTEQRLEQGVIEGCNGKYENAMIGNFIKWISQDIIKESEDELEASGLEWKDVAKTIGTEARNWYLSAIKKV